MRIRISLPGSKSPGFDEHWNSGALRAARIRGNPAGASDGVKGRERRKEKGTPEQVLFEGIGKLEKLRKSHRVFLNAAAVRTAETYDPSVLCLVRELEGEKLAAVFNFSGRAGTAWIKEEGEYLDLLSGERMTGEEVPVGPFQARWLLQIQK